MANWVPAIRRTGATRLSTRSSATTTPPLPGTVEMCCTSLTARSFSLAVTSCRWLSLSRPSRGWSTSQKKRSSSTSITVSSITGLWWCLGKGGISWLLTISSSRRTPTAAKPWSAFRRKSREKLPKIFDFYRTTLRTTLRSNYHLLYYWSDQYSIAFFRKSNKGRGGKRKDGGF